MAPEAPQGPVTQCVQLGEVHTEVSHTQEFWRHMESPQVHRGCDPSMPKVEAALWGFSPLYITEATPPAPALCDSPTPTP